MEKGISFIIPTLNEAKTIKKCVESISKLTKISPLKIETIVVDNGSEDNTQSIASEVADIVLTKTNCTVGALRNYGVEKSNYDILTFIDGDCEVTEKWIKNIEKYIDSMDSDRIGIVGSPVVLPPNSNHLQKVWFSHKKEKYIGETEYLGSANLTIKKGLFNKIGCFSDTLISGEDYDLCMKVKENNHKVLSDYRLEVIHYGYPENLSSFIKREIWHGKGMIADLRNPLKSKPLMYALFIILIGLLIIFYILLYNVTFKSVVLLFTLFFLPAFFYAFIKVFENKKYYYFPTLLSLYLVYGFARSFSLLLIIYEYLKKIIFKTVDLR